MCRSSLNFARECCCAFPRVRTISAFTQLKCEYSNVEYVHGSFHIKLSFKFVTEQINMASKPTDFASLSEELAEVETESRFQKKLNESPFMVAGKS